MKDRMRFGEAYSSKLDMLLSHLSLSLLFKWFFVECRMVGRICIFSFISIAYSLMNEIIKYS